MEPLDVEMPDVVQTKVPFKERWEVLKPDLERLYLDEKLKLSKIVAIMKEEYHFDAYESQYKYQFKKWGWKKNISSLKKQAILDIGQKRAALGKSMVITYKGKSIDTQKLRRDAKKSARKEGGMSSAVGRPLTLGSSLPVGNTIFLNWNMPYGALRWRAPHESAHPSPLGPSVSTPSDVSIRTPSVAAVSPYNPPSPLSVTLKRRTAVERAHLFVQGKHDELIRSLSTNERRIMSTWLYQFWLFSFKTAKHWGKGPRNWTADILGFHDAQTTVSVPSPSVMFVTTSPPLVEQLSSNEAAVVGKPSPLCIWSIHVRQEQYEPIESPSDERASWDIESEWPEAWTVPPFEDRLRDNLESNDFSSIKADQLPLAIPQVVKAAKRSPSELLQEALGFSIMGRNVALVEELLRKVRVMKVDVSGLFPYHLATSYLDGSRSCCQILELLFQYVPMSRDLYTDKRGHTLLDNLMIAILRNHTNVRPGTVDNLLKDEARFSGEEVDICGRWDADSDCYRNLLSTGTPTIPIEWKHKFCNTSIQTICHSIMSCTDYGFPVTPSGLFLKYCSYCGMRLQLLPLHTLVLTAVHLGRSGCKDEDLFGMVCCLLCLLANGVDPSATAELSLDLLLGADETECCSHRRVSPAELAHQVPQPITDCWSDEARTGWQVFRHVLREAQNGCGVSDDTDPAGSSEESVDAGIGYRADCTLHGREERFRGSSVLGHIWAAAQTELLNYRRQKESDPWLSENFNMNAVLRSLEDKTAISIPLVEKKMMKPYCACGSFGSTFLHARREDVSMYYFSNLGDDWSRTTILDDSVVY